MIRLFAALSILVQVAGCATAKSPQKNASNGEITELQMAYDIEPTQYEGKPALKISLQFLGGYSGRTFLNLPYSKAKGLNFLENIKEFRVTSENAHFNDTFYKGMKYIEHRPGEPVGITYILVPSKNTETKSTEVVIEKDYFYWSAHSGLAVPNWNNDEPMGIRIRWKNFPKDYIFPNSFAQKNEYQLFKATYEEFFDGVYLGGRLKLNNYEVDGKPLMIASLGNWKFTEAELFQTLSRIVSLQRQFWNDDGNEKLLVSLLPFRGNKKKSAGRAFHQAFAMFVGSERKIDVRIRSLISHEMFHSWNGRIISPPRGEEYRHTTWFTEGFTNYYANIFLLKSGLMTFREYVDELNYTLYSYYTSPYRNTPNEQNAESVYVDLDAQILPYLRGELLAHNWNYRLKTQGKPGANLDLVMKDLFKASQVKRNSLTNSLIDDTFENYLKTGIKPQIKDYVSQGKTIEPEAFPLGPCVRVAKARFAKPTKVDADKTAKTVHEAMLNKEKLVKGIKQQAKDAAGMIEIPQLRLDEAIFKSDPKGCLAFLFDEAPLNAAVNP